MNAYTSAQVMKVVNVSGKLRARKNLMAPHETDFWKVPSLPTCHRMTSVLMSVCAPVRIHGLSPVGDMSY